MSRAERTDLARVARMRGKLARDQAAARGAEVLADAERKLSDVFAVDEAQWAALTKRIEALVAETNLEVARRCDEMDVPKRFRPHMGTYWLDRGENARPKRRAELRQRVKARVVADVKGAQAAIDLASLGVQERLLRDGLTSAAAHAFLDAMPSPVELLPALAVDDIRAITGRGAP